MTELERMHKLCEQIGDTLKLAHQLWNETDYDVHMCRVYQLLKDADDEANKAMKLAKNNPKNILR